MDLNRSGVAAVMIRVMRASLAERVTFLAAGIAYYAFISIIPLIVLLISISSLVGGERLAAVVIGFLDHFLTPSAQELVHAAIVGGVGRAGATTVSIFVFLWSGLKVFRGLDIAFSTVYGTVQEDSVVDHVVNVVTALLGIGFGIVLTVVIFTAVRLSPVGSLIGTLVSTVMLFIALSIVLFPMFYVFPSQEISVREALPGTLLAAGGWTALSALFNLYTSIAVTYLIYGVLGGILLLITIFYAGALILLIGAVTNAVLAGRSTASLEASMEDDALL